VKIVVLVKEVPEASARTRIDPGSLRLDRSGTAALNPFDAHALEEALRVNEAQGEGEVVAVMMAPASAADSLRKALAIGADRAVHVADDALAELNERLGSGGDVTPDTARRMGLFVVGRLAARHGVRVRLRHAQAGGLTALIWLPDTVAAPEVSARKSSNSAGSIVSVLHMESCSPSACQ